MKRLIQAGHRPKKGINMISHRFIPELRSDHGKGTGSFSVAD
jgi:hypothetical protein